MMQRLKLQKMKKLEVKVKTKSNYNNCNGQWLDVVEIKGSRVTCNILDNSTGRMVNADFTIKEVVEFSYK